MLARNLGRWRWSAFAGTFFRDRRPGAKGHAVGVLAALSDAGHRVLGRRGGADANAALQGQEAPQSNPQVSLTLVPEAKTFKVAVLSVPHQEASQFYWCVRVCVFLEGGGGPMQCRALLILKVCPQKHKYSKHSS